MQKYQDNKSKNLQKSLFKFLPFNSTSKILNKWYNISNEGRWQYYEEMCNYHES